MTDVREFRSSDDAWIATCHTDFAFTLFDPTSRYVTDAQWDTMEAMPGWCRREKAEALVRLILFGHVRTAVEIGVYGGRSLHALALGLGGVDDNPDLAEPLLLGLDPWDAEFLGDPMQTTLEGVAAHMRQHWPRTMLLRASGAAIVQLGRAVDLLHVDGEHAAPAPLRDVQAWLPRLRPCDGYIVMDDAHYPGVREATAWLVQQGAVLLCSVTYADRDPQTNDIGGWQLYHVVR